MSFYNIVIESNNATVVSEYKNKTKRSDAYQTEAELEKTFIKMLQEQSYEYLPIHEERDLINNLRKQLESLNKVKFSESEWSRLFNEQLANPNESIKEKTRKIQEESILNLKLDNGLTKNITLIDKNNIHENKLQVINQYVNNDGKYSNRYDVTILVNGFPLVHVELKRRGVEIREAFNQIDRYKRESFWAQSGLYEYIQIFVISNGTNTKYYSNSTRDGHVKDAIKNKNQQKKKTSNSFEFTSFWADGNNQIIPDLIDFTKTFFSKHTLLNILTKYCIFTSEQILLVMRPYQIAATERIINRINISNNYKTYGKIEAGGYIWHTTGSGKTLTSFKTAQLATKLPYIDKVLFVVDRKDLDYQTMKEYDRFEKGAANSNKSTIILKKQLEDPNAKIIITTIQKLSNFIEKYKDHEVYKKHFVIIFDECHRSQFGDMHNKIIKKFKKYHIFGFTGTPIFAKNASANVKHIDLKTTEQAFGDKLHTYTVVNAINDKNVLPFRIDYIKTMEINPKINDEQVYDIEREENYLAPERISKIVDYILNHFNQKTYRNKENYLFNGLTNISELTSKNNVNESRQEIRLSGFNSILCVSSIDAAKLYYKEFKKQIESNPINKINIATIFSYGANEEVDDNGNLSEENSEDTSNLDASSRDFLETAIKDYNKEFKTTFDTSSEKFQNYYRDVSLRMKNKQIDLLIVVNMFLTGFDATTLNTLWVDKNLKQHGLMQAFSRTNRILNSIKRFGNIICFRNLEKQVNDAIATFGDKDARSICILKSYNDYYNGYIDNNGIHRVGYVDLIKELKLKYPLSEPQIIGEKNQKDFIRLFGNVLRSENILKSFDEFTIDKQILTEGEKQDYLSKYNDLYEEWRRNKDTLTKENIIDDIVFEIELVKQVEINIDYILLLVKKYHANNCNDKEIVNTINKAIDSSLELRSKKELIQNFINKVNDFNNIQDEWHQYIFEEKEKELSKIIDEEKLNSEQTRKFIQHSFEDGALKTTGIDIDKLLPPISRFDGTNNRYIKKISIIERLRKFFEKFFGIF